MQTTLKVDICNFLEYGVVTASHSLEEFKYAFCFLEYVCNESTAATNAGTFIIAKNNNWFWLKGNDANRQELIKDIEKVMSFDNKDPYIKDIMSRIDFGDAYGIVKPIPRDCEERLDLTDLKEAYDYYSQFSDLSRIKDSLNGEHGYKFIYCWKNKKPLSDFQGWVTCEVILNQPINFGEYKAVDEVFYGAPKEILQIYGTDEYFQTVEQMKTALFTCHQNFPLYREDMISKITEAELFGKYNELKNLYKELRSFYEPPEGSELMRKSGLKDSFEKEVLKKFPADVVQALKICLGGTLYG